MITLFLFIYFEILNNLYFIRLKILFNNIENILLNQKIFNIYLSNLIKYFQYYLNNVYIKIIKKDYFNYFLINFHDFLLQNSNIIRLEL
jgi:hypothetical protein